MGDFVLGRCIDRCAGSAAGGQVDLADRLLLKASGTAVASIFTAHVNYVGVLQRCQSPAEGLLDPEPLPSLVRSLPWRLSAYQFVLYGGIMALNVKLVQWKLQLQAEELEDDTEQRAAGPHPARLAPRNDASRAI